MDKLEKSIVLIGFMGVGKTTVGKLLSEKLNRKFIDTDDELEKEFNMPITQVFSELGERTFRVQEKSLIEEFAKAGNLVLSLGGGAFLQEDTRNICLNDCTVIFLNMSFEKWKGRMSSLISTRPILQGKTINDVEELFFFRQKIYSDHHLKITVDDREPEEIANDIIKRLTGGEAN